MWRDRLLIALGVVTTIGCGETETNSEPVAANRSTGAAVGTPKSEPTPAKPQLGENTKPWRTDAALAGRFHPKYPDDLQVIVHDGGPRFSEKTPELVWVTVTAQQEKAYRGKVLNQPQGLQSVKQGDEILFLFAAQAEHPIRVSEKYLAERKNWMIEPCNQCGFGELFDAPSDLINKVFPGAGKNSDEKLEAFSSFCPMCGGVQVVHQSGLKGE